MPDAAQNQRDPLVASATPARWRQWLASLITAGQKYLAALGLTLVAGFLSGMFALYAFAKIADDVMEQETQRIDLAVFHFFRDHATTAGDSIATAISLLGSQAVLIVLLVVALILIRARRWGAVGALVVVTAGAQILNSFLKAWFQRSRPLDITMHSLFPAQDFSFPSGHAMVSAAFYLFLAYLAWRLLKGWIRVLCAGGLLLLILLIGLTRLYLGVHYLTDVIGGYFAGFLWTNAVIMGGHILSRFQKRPIQNTS